MKVIETVGKDIEQALNAGFAELGCKPDDVEVKILVHPGIFRKARVCFTYHGDETVEKKTAAGVMRNLSERAAKGAPEQNGKQRDRDRNNNRGQNGQNLPNGNRFDNRNNPNRNQNNQNNQNNQSNQNNPVSRNDRNDRNNQNNRNGQNLAAGASQKPNGGQAGQQKMQQNGFRRDFRAELNEAVGGNKAGKPEASGAKTEASGGATPAQSRPAKEFRKELRDDPLTPEELAAAQKKAVAYLTKLTALMGVETEISAEVKDGDVDIAFSSSDDTLIGFRGETIEALEHLATVAANDGDGRYVRLNLDAGDYRARRNEMIVANAIARADKAVATGRRMDLEPMNSAARRLVHAALGERNDVITRSEGRDPNRYIVIIPKRQNAGKPNGGNVGGGNNNKKNKHKNRDRQNRPDGAPRGDSGNRAENRNGDQSQSQSQNANPSGAQSQNPPRENPERGAESGQPSGEREKQEKE